MESSKILDKIYKNSLDIYINLDKRKIEIDEIYNFIINNKYKNTIIKKNNSKIENDLINKYDKLSILDEILLLTDDRYKHLKDIRYLVRLDDLLEFILPRKLYIDKVKVYYTNMIIDKMLEKYYDYESSKLLSNLKIELLEIDKSINKEITNNIDKYYVNRITI